MLLAGEGFLQKEIKHKSAATGLNRVRHHGDGSRVPGAGFNQLAAAYFTV
jgi:hypothetical protein